LARSQAISDERSARLGRRAARFDERFCRARSLRRMLLGFDERGARPGFLRADDRNPWVFSYL
jgi:hypothetical protein